MERKLAAILAADMVGYSRHVHDSEEAALTQLRQLRVVIDAVIESHHGRIFDTAGDSVLAEFNSPVEAVRCAIEVQEAVAERNSLLPDARHMEFRIGVHLGDVVVEEAKLKGEGINIAARLEALADPGGILLSGDVYRQVHRTLKVGFDGLGQRQLKNIDEPIEIYRVLSHPTATAGLQRLIRSAKRRMRTTPNLMTAVPLAAAAILAALTWSQGMWGQEDRPSTPAGKPSIAVMPFQNIGADPEQEYLADGLAEDIITDLSKFRDLSVMARAASFTYKSKSASFSTVRDELGVRYILEGSVRRAGDTVRISAQLTDTADGRSVWAERYDRKLENILEIQDDVTSTIAGTLTGTQGMIALAELRKVDEKPPKSFAAYDYLLKGWHEWYKFTKESNAEARRLFELARGADPSFARAYAGLAWTYSLDYEYDWTEEYDATVANALEMAKTAVRLDDKDYRSYWVLGWANLYSRQYDQAEAAYAKARQMNPNDTELMAEMTSLLIYDGKPQDAVAQLKEAIRRNPLHEEWYVEYLGWAYQEAGMAGECVDVLSKIIRDPPSQAQLWLLRLIATCYADPQVNRMEDARKTAAKILSLDPGFSTAKHRQYVIDALPYKSPALVDHWIAALDRVGLPK
jgi:adenylate cyclase